MRFIIRSLLLAIISLAIFGYVIYFTKPPSSWNEASTLQILSFFIPLLLFLTFLINLFLNYLPRSFAIGISLMLLALLKTVDQLNIFTLILDIILIVLFFIFFKKPPFIRRKGLTRNFKIPKLKNLGRRNS